MVRDPQAFLATTVTRLAINVLQSARTRRETYIGPWLPEPVDTTADPGLGAERGEALQLAVLVLLERLSPTERAAYVCAKPSTTRIKKLRRFSASKRPTRVSSLPAHASMSRMDGEHASATPIRNASCMRSLPRRRTAISLNSSGCSPPPSSRRRMAADSFVRLRSRSSVASGSPRTSRPSLNGAGPVSPLP